MPWISMNIVRLYGTLILILHHDVTIVCVCGVFLVSHMIHWFVSTCENSAQLDQAVHEGQNLMYLIPQRMMADVSCKDPCAGRKVGTRTWPDIDFLEL